MRMLGFGKAMRQGWSGMGQPERAVVGVLVAVDIAAKAYAFFDLSKTDKARIRGSKALWAVLIGVVNTLGWLVYFLFGKRK